MPLSATPAASATRVRRWPKRVGIAAGALLGLCLLLAVVSSLIGNDTSEPTPTTAATDAEREVDDVATAVVTLAPTASPTATLPPTPTATSSPSPAPTPPLPSGIPERAIPATVVDIIDGDTLVVAFGVTQETVRLLGVDTPETRFPGQPVECFGPEATARTRALVPPGSTVWLERDVTDRDRYSRLLRYVWYLRADTGSADLLNERLVAEGYAVVSTYAPDVKYVERFLAAQQLARERGLGLWTACAVPEPTPTRTPRPALTPTPASAQPKATTPQLLSLTSPVRPGGTAIIEVQTEPLARCSITVVYRSGPSKAKGLEAKQADQSGYVVWTWTVGTRTTPGTWPVHVTCDGQTLETAIQVLG